MISKRPRRVSRIKAAMLATGMTALPATARAEGEPKSVTGGYSPYEKASIDQAVAKLGTSADPDPEGKVVEGIDIVTLDVIEPRDPAPSFLNAFHATTRRYVIERELLLAPGEPFRGVLCDETARNLRQLPQLSLVVCTATRAKAEGQVRVLVITKDVWSLRLGWDGLYVGGGLESLQLVPTEMNLGGSHQIAFLRYVYQPESQSATLGYRIPRLAGRRIGLSAESGIIWNRRGEPEGSAGALGVSHPLYSARSEWAWAVGSLWRHEILRRYENAKLVFDPKGVPWAYRAERSAVGGNITRSFGWAMKNDITFGTEMNIRVYHPPDVLTRTSPISQGEPDYRTRGQVIPLPSDVASFTASNVPTSDTRVGPYLQYRGYTSNFLRVLDMETLGLQEDYRLGHDVALRLYPIAKALGSTRDFLGTLAAAQYTVGLGDGIARAAVESTIEAEEHRLSDATIDASLRIVTPRLGVGRLVFDGVAQNRYRNYMNRTSYLGGSDRLRGYPSNFFSGKDVVAYNVEFRSRPVEILSCQLGGAAFYDAGHAANGFDRLRMRHAVGVGLRMLFPQLDRLVFRWDIGFPLEPGLDRGVSPLSFSVAFEQAFSVPSVGAQVASGAATGWLGQ
jgi:hypothetical protein